MNEIVVIGSTNLDIVAKVSHLPLLHVPGNLPPLDRF